MYTTGKNWHLNCWLLIFSVFLLNKTSNLKTMNTIKNDWSFKINIAAEVKQRSNLLRIWSMYLFCIMINKIMINKKRVEDFISNLEEKAAAKVRGQIWDFLIAQNDLHVMFSLCTKFHTFIIKWMIIPKWCKSVLFRIINFNIILSTFPSWDSLGLLVCYRGHFFV